MIDWEDSFDLEALASKLKSDPEDASERRSARHLSLLQRRGVMEVDTGEDDLADLFAEEDSSEDDGN